MFFALAFKNFLTVFCLTPINNFGKHALNCQPEKKRLQGLTLIITKESRSDF